MIRINLLPVKAIKAEFGRRRELVIAGLSLGMAIALMLGLYLFQSYRLHTLGKGLASLRKEIDALNVQVKDIGELQKRNRELQSKLDAINSLSKKKTGPVRVMESLSSATPSRLWLTEFKDNKGNLTITGLAVDNQTIADFLKALSTHEYFQNVDLVEATQIEQDGVPLKRFSIKSTLLYQVPPPSSPEKAGAPSATKEGKPATKEKKQK
ncbi:MAG: PilN domain-containing protein [Candidatus Binatia bacterium]